MSWYNPFSWIKRRDPRQNHDFSDEERTRAVEVSRERARLKRLQDQKAHELKMLEMERDRIALEDEIADLTDDDEDEDFDTEDSADALLVKLLQPILQRGTHPVSPAAGSPATPSPGAAAQIHLMDDQLREIWNNQPVHIRSAAKVSSDERIEEVILSRYPNIDEDTLNRAIQIVRND